MLCDITTNSVVSLFALVLRSHYIAGLVQLFEDGILKAPFSLMMIIIMWLPDRAPSANARAAASAGTSQRLWWLHRCPAALLAQAARYSVVRGRTGHRPAVVDETMTNENIFHIHNIDRRPALTQPH